MTTSTSSANALGLPDRRRLLATLAGAGALGLPALPVLAAAPGPIEAMYPAYLRIEAEHDAALLRVGDAEELYEEPDRPRWHPVHEAGGYRTIQTRPGFDYSVLDDGPENIAYLKDAIAKEHKPDTGDWGTSNKVRGRRARKTLAKIEAWQAEVDRRKIATGLAKARAELDASTEIREAHCAAMFAIEAATFRELAHQAAILEHDWRGSWAMSVQARLLALADVTPYQA